MRASLVARAVAALALLVVLSFAVLAVIVHRATSDVFIETQERLESAAGAWSEDGPRLAAALAPAWREGAGAVRDRLDAMAEPDGPILIVAREPDLAVIAASEPAFEHARLERSGGTIQIRLYSEGESDRIDLEIVTEATWPIRLSETVAWLVLAPPAPRRDEANAFADSVWRAIAFPLALVALAAIAIVVWLSRSALKPIDDVIGAARRLQDRRRAAPLEPSGDADLDKLIAAFNEASTAIADADEMRRAFIADIAHELRTPVTNLAGQIEAVEQGLLPASEEFLATMKSELRLLERLVDDFQELALSDAGKLRLFTRRIGLLDAVCDIMTPQSEQHGFRFETDVPAELEVFADHERLRQVFSNLTENAVRHRRDGLVIQVRARAEAAMAVIEFTDNGPGVAADDQPHIFERFYRSDKSRNRSSGGAGLGLAIVGNLMRAMAGEIRYLDGRGGACFELRLPAAN